MVPVATGRILVKMSHTIDLVDYRPSPGFEQQVEARRTRIPAPPRLPYHRIDFHLVVIADEGAARVAVDFAAHEIVPGTVVWIRPGQVYRWLDVRDLGAIALIFPAGLLDPAVESPGDGSGGAPTRWTLAGGARDDVLALAGILERAHGRRSADTSDALRRTASRHLLAALALRLLREADGPVPSTATSAFGRFRAAVDSGFAERHAVADYAAALGYSTRTLSRLTRAATGLSPKQVIDARILLEARRLLAHTDLPVVRIGVAVGFDDASNFTSWFAIRAGCTPSEFRARIGPATSFAG